MKPHSYLSEVAEAIGIFLGILIFGAGCASNLTTEEKVQVCEQALQVLVQPECHRLTQVDPRYVTLCLEVVDSAVVACAAGFNNDPAIMCSRLSSAASHCAELVPGDDPRNVESCERVLRASHLACTLAVSSTRDAAATQ